MNTNNKVIPFIARPVKPAPKPWVGPLQAERDRCIAVLVHPASHGSWAGVARTLLCETVLGADEIIVKLNGLRSDFRAEIAADLAAGRPLV